MKISPHQLAIEPARIAVQLVVEAAAPQGCMRGTTVRTFRLHASRGRIVMTIRLDDGWVQVGRRRTRSRRPRVGCGLRANGQRRSSRRGVGARPREARYGLGWA